MPYEQKPNPRPLVETDWLAQHLSDPDLRILECTVFFIRKNTEVVLESGRGEWEKSHIPGSLFADLIVELSDPESRFRFTLPREDQFAEAMSELGVGEESRVVLYDRAGTNWAARVWWMLRYFGFENASILNGGFSKWITEGRAVTDDVPTFPQGRFTPHIQPGWLSQKEEVISAIWDTETGLVYALDSGVYDGKRIPESRTVTATKLISKQTGMLLPEAELKRRFTEAGAFAPDRIITYCGSGIAASLDAFVLYMLGKCNISVYDGGLLEWMSEPALPIERDG
jgi:thiosulfate/3-mercaptopyruvate sulfurtransferase